MGKSFKMKFDELGFIRGDNFGTPDQTGTGDVCNREGVYEALCLMGATRPERKLSLSDCVAKLTVGHELSMNYFVRYPVGFPDSSYLCTSADQTIPWIVARTFSIEPILKIAITLTYYMLTSRFGFFTNVLDVHTGKRKPWHHFTDIARPGVWAALIRSRYMTDKKWMLYFLDAYHILDAISFCHIYSGDDDIQWLLMIEQAKRKWPTFWIDLADKYYRKFRKIDSVESYYTSRGFKDFITMWREVRK